MHARRAVRRSGVHDRLRLAEPALSAPTPSCVRGAAARWLHPVSRIDQHGGGLMGQNTYSSPTDVARIRGAPALITSHEVARAAGVSQATVSRALRNEPGVSPATRARVRAAARDLGYVTGHAGRALATRRTRTVGVVSPTLDNPFYPAFVTPLQAALHDAGLLTVLVTDSDEGALGVDSLMDGSFDGVVLTSCERHSTLPAELSARGIPVVLADRLVDGAVVDTCVSDNRFGAAVVADLLVELGHERIATIMGPGSTSTGYERHAGFVERLGALGVAGAAITVIRGPFEAEAGRRGLETLLGDGSSPPTAVFCGNDVIALGVLDAAKGLGVRIPEDLTVVGFDDIPLAAWGRFDLTTVHVDLDRMAQTVVEALVARLADPQAAPKQVVLAPRLVARGTHAPPPERASPARVEGGRTEARTLRSWMSAVSAVARAVNATYSSDAVLTMVAKRACDLIEFDYCAVMLADESERELSVVGFDGLTSEYVDLVSEKGALQVHPATSEHDTPAARAFRERRTIAVPDTRTATVFGRLRDLAPAQGYRSLLAPRSSGSAPCGACSWATASSRTRSQRWRSSWPSCSPSRPRSSCRPPTCAGPSRTPSTSCPP